MSELEKLNLTTHDNISGNVEKIGELFPNCVTETKDKEGNLKKTIDFEMLKQMLSSDVVEGKERYEFTWPGKKASIVEANKPITKTLRPCIEESKDWETTKNLYIEGDNLDALKLLQQSYLGKIKMIYIDPPYNTGNDFIYEDDFKKTEESYSEDIGQYDEYGNRMFKNTDSNGRFHSDWCSMIYPRLLLARNLLSKDGFIFISIDENEIDNLKYICNEIFGQSNSLGTFIWRKKEGGGQAKDAFVIEHEFILVYKKSDESKWIDKSELRSTDEFNKKDEKGLFRITKLAKWGNTARREDRPSMYFSIKAPDGSACFPISPDGGNGRWRIGVERMQSLIKEDLIHWEKKEGTWVPYEKEYFNNQKKIIKERSILYKVANTGDGSNILTDLFGKKDIFENPKPIKLMDIFLKSTTTNDSIILDFFSGSATTAHAVMQLNSEGGDNRTYILVQVPELCDTKSEACKSGYKTICDIGKERIRRAGEKIKSENPDKDLDIGFRVLKIDSSNMKEVYFNPNELSQSLLSNLESNIKEDRTSEDLFFSCLLEFGLTLDKSIETKEISGKKIIIYNDNPDVGPDLIACFDSDITEEVITEIAKKKPLKVVFRDDSFKDSPTKINLFEIFKMHAGITDESELRTRIKVI